MEREPLHLRIARVLLERPVCLVCLASKFGVTQLDTIRAVEGISITVIVARALQCEVCGTAVGPIFSLPSNRADQPRVPMIIPALRGRSLCATCIAYEVGEQRRSVHDATQLLHLLGRDHVVVGEINRCDCCERVTVVYQLAER